jgi:hypothetical protein
VQRLARGQERSLRNWLYKPTASPTERFSAAVEQAAAEVEDTYAISVETVVVGDTDSDERVAALVAAAREAMVNAARHAGVETVSLYAEVEPEELSVFVRDRGAGFDLDGIEDSRHGVRGSIIGRMQRHGGHAEIRSAPGDGTEVRLTLPTSRDNGATGKSDRIERSEDHERMPEAKSAKESGTMTESAAGENRRLTVFLVDDHAMFRAGVRAEARRARRRGGRSQYGGRRDRPDRRRRTGRGPARRAYARRRRPRRPGCDAA